MTTLVMRNAATGAALRGGTPARVPVFIEPGASSGCGYLVPAEIDLIGDETWPYDATFDWDIQDGRLGVRRVEFHQRDGGPALTATALRQVPWSMMADAAYQSIRVDVKIAGDEIVGWEFTDLEAQAGRLPSAAKTGMLTHTRVANPRKGHRRSKADLARVAEAMRSAPPGRLVGSVCEVVPCSKASAYRWMDAAEAEWPALAKLRPRKQR